ncbi:MAG: DUF4239 domain-containing protein [Roseiarcus sp.]|jgi:hypothetical protein
MILHLLHHLSDQSILALTVVVVAGITALAPHFGRHVLRLPKNDERDNGAFEGFKAVMAMTGVVLAFSLVQANANLREVDATVAKEAATISMTDRALLRFGKLEATVLRPLLADYGRAVVDEWPLLMRRQRSEAADASYTALSKNARAIEPDDSRQQTMYGELLKDLDDLSDLREEVLADSAYGLPKFFWIANASLLALGVVLAGLTAGSLGRTVGVAAPAAAVALLLAMVMIVDLPFEGETSVGPRAIENALAANAHRS